MFRPPKPETMTRIAAERKREWSERRAQFEHYYRAALAQFPDLPALDSLPTDQCHYWQEFTDGRAVGIGVNGWREE